MNVKINNPRIATVRYKVLEMSWCCSWVCVTDFWRLICSDKAELGIADWWNETMNFHWGTGGFLRVRRSDRSVVIQGDFRVKNLYFYTCYACCAFWTAPPVVDNLR